MFLDLVEYYLWFIKNFSKIVIFGKLFGILNVRKNFKSEKCLTDAPVLALPSRGGSCDLYRCFKGWFRMYINTT